MIRPPSLEDRYTLEEGVIFASGVQALVRLPLDRQRLDRRLGLRTAGFISGYPGSPLGTYDLALTRAAELLRRHDIVHVPGVNEELAATSVFGSQIAHVFPGRRFDGVVGYWYGKGPGVDRSGDAFKHAGFVGTQAHGGALLFAGDDPVAKSSTLPYGSEATLASFCFPILYPGNVQEVLDLGLHGVALSRFSGSWVAMKMVNNVCDGGGTAEVAPDRITPVKPDFAPPALPVPEAWRHLLLAIATLPLESHVYRHRLGAAAAYARANRLNELVINPPRARLGIIAGGKTFCDLRQALKDMNLSDEELYRAGVRLLRLGMIFPLDPAEIVEFASGLEEIVVVEEKRSFIELQIRELLYNVAERPRVVGKLDADHQPLVPIAGGLSAATITSILGPRLLRLSSLPAVKARLEEMEEIARRPDPSLPARLLNFCSGCPHNRSTRLLEGQVAGGGIGCHTMAVLTGQNQRRFEYVTQMGGEGAVWIGAAPFVDQPHIFQNLGDGTYFHSGRLGVQAAVAAGARMTFKILYNSGVAMTGGQQPAGNLTIAAMTRELHALGVNKIILVAEDPRAHRLAREHMAPAVTIYGREQMDRALRECESTAGVSILIYDQACAADRRRRRRRGLEVTPSRWVVINEEVCEGCGDCGEKSNCMSVVPIETELGRKTAIHLSSCNQDYSCLEGDCPAFVLVETRSGGGLKRPEPREVETQAPEEPASKVKAGGGYSILMTGIGGTGVVTVNALLAYAALLDGKRCLNLDQIGVAQKGGALVSSIVIADNVVDGSSEVSQGRADLFLGLDIIGAVKRENLAVAHPSRTAAVINTTGVATAEMVRNKEVSFPEREELVSRISAATDPQRTIFAEAGALAEALFQDHMITNLFCLGIAYQAGLVPLTADSLEAAIRLNRVAVERSLAAFRWGRRLVAEPEALEPFRPSGERRADEARRQALQDVTASGARAVRELEQLTDTLAGSAELRRVLEIRTASLILYQNAAYASDYLEFVEESRLTEEGCCPGCEAITLAVARNLYKLMANKDEYEVARLHLRQEARRRVDESFKGVRRVSFLLLPPALRRWGLQRKLAMGPAMRPLLRLLAALKGLRGTPLDLFGYTQIRRQERALPDWYRELMQEALSKLVPENHATVVALAELPDAIRGYEEIRMRSLDIAKARAAELLAELAASHQRRAAG